MDSHASRSAGAPGRGSSLARANLELPVLLRRATSDLHMGGAAPASFCVFEGAGGAAPHAISSASPRTGASPMDFDVLRRLASVAAGRRCGIGELPGASRLDTPIPRRTAHEMVSRCTHPGRAAAGRWTLAATKRAAPAYGTPRNGGPEAPARCSARPVVVCGATSHPRRVCGRYREILNCALAVRAAVRGSVPGISATGIRPIVVAHPWGPSVSRIWSDTLVNHNCRPTLRRPDGPREGFGIEREPLPRTSALSAHAASSCTSSHPPDVCRQNQRARMDMRIVTVSLTLDGYARPEDTGMWRPCLRWTGECMDIPHRVP